MRLRLANKIRAAVGTPRERAYTSHQVRRAQDRHDRTRSARSAQALWDAYMRALGAIGRAKLVEHWEGTGAALDVLMGAPESEWNGDSRMLDAICLENSCAPR